MRTPLQTTSQTTTPRPRPRRSRDDFSAEHRLREAGGPEDRCLYSCSCGHAFQASVTTSVRCPHCGDSQAW